MSYNYSLQSVEQINTRYETEEQFLNRHETILAYKNTFSEDFLQNYPGSEILFPSQTTTSAFFDHISLLGELYGVLLGEFEIQNKNTKVMIPNIEKTKVSFELIGSQFEVMQFISRLEETAPLTTIKEFSLELNETSIVKGTIQLELSRFIHRKEKGNLIDYDKKPLDLIPDFYSTYPFLYNIREKEIEVSPTEPSE